MGFVVHPAGNPQILRFAQQLCSQLDDLSTLEETWCLELEARRNMSRKKKDVVTVVIIFLKHHHISSSNTSSSITINLILIIIIIINRCSLCYQS